MLCLNSTFVRRKIVNVKVFQIKDDPLMMKIIFVVCIVASYLLQTVQIEREEEILIPGVSASKVMRYVGDWNNHKNLNPHILDWSIEDIDNVSSDQTILRSYRLSYTELYEHIPWLTNTAEGLVTLTHKDKVININQV